MRIPAFAVLILFLSLATGCGLIERLETKAAFSVGAEPLVVDCAASTPASATSATSATPRHECVNQTWVDFQATTNSALGDSLKDKREYLGFVANESEKLCGEFVGKLIVAANGTNTGLDMGTTVFSALGTALTPLTAVHAMTAGSTITSGWKTAIDSDIYAKLTVQNLVQAIQTTYYKDMENYLTDLAGKDSATIVVTSELGHIQVIHSECTLASAEGTITATLGAGSGTNASASQISTAILTIAVKGGGNAAGTDTLTLKGTSPTLANIPTASYTVTTKDTASTIASGLAKAVQDKITSQIPSITAKANNATVHIFSSASDSVTWSPTLTSSASSGVTLQYTPAPAAKKSVHPGESATQ